MHSNWVDSAILLRLLPAYVSLALALVAVVYGMFGSVAVNFCIGVVVV
jgi:hypothetical protein